MISIKSALAKPFAKRVYKNIQKWAKNPLETQEKVFQELISEATQTQFGKDHNFKKITSFEEFVNGVTL